MTPEALAIWAGTIIVVSTQLLTVGIVYGRLVGELRLIKYRMLRVERALELHGLAVPLRAEDATL